MPMDSAAIPGSSRAQHRILDILAAVPKLLADKLFWSNAPGDEEIDLGKLRVITGSKYRQYCRTKYGANYLDLFAQKYLSDSSADGGTGRSHFLAGPTAVRFYRNLLGVSDAVGDDGEPAPYEEPEGVTTIPLPPVAPVLFAFLVWRAGKHGMKFFETWRERLKRQSESANAEESRRPGREPNQGGLLEFVYDRMMGFMDSEFEPTSQSAGSELSALELPFLVALPTFPSETQDSVPRDELQGLGDNPPPRLHATNPDSVQSSTPRNQRSRSLAIALNISTPDSVGLRRVIVGTQSPDTTPSNRSNITLEDVLYDLANDPSTSAIMNGIMINPDAFHEPEIDTNHTPRSSANMSYHPSLGDGKGPRPIDSPFSLLLRPCSFHQDEVLAPPKRDYVDANIYSDFDAPNNIPVHQQDTCIASNGYTSHHHDSKVLVLLLDGDSALHEHDEQLPDTLNNTPAATAGSPPWARELDEASPPLQHDPNSSILLNPSHTRTSPKSSSKRHATLQDTPHHPVMINIQTESRAVASKVHGVDESGSKLPEGSARARKPSHSRNSHPPPPTSRSHTSAHVGRHSHSNNQEISQENLTLPKATAELNSSAPPITRKPRDLSLPINVPTSRVTPQSTRHRRHRSGSHVQSDISLEAPAMAGLSRPDQSSGAGLHEASALPNPLRPRISSLPSASQPHTISRGHSRTHSVEYTQSRSLVEKTAQANQQSRPRFVENHAHQSMSKDGVPQGRSHRRKTSARPGPPLTQYPRTHVCQEQGVEIRRPDSPHPLRPPLRHGQSTHTRRSQRTPSEVKLASFPRLLELNSHPSPEPTSSQSHLPRLQSEVPQSRPRYQQLPGSHAIPPLRERRSQSDHERIAGSHLLNRV